MSQSKIWAERAHAALNEYPNSFRGLVSNLAGVCGHGKCKPLADTGRWCRGCGALYVFTPKLGWHWLAPDDRAKTEVLEIVPDVRKDKFY